MNRNIKPSKKSLDCLVNDTAQTIQVGSIVSIDADYKHSHVYFMVKLTYSPYTIQ